MIPWPDFAKARQFEHALTEYGDDSLDKLSIQQFEFNSSPNYYAFWCSVCSSAACDHLWMMFEYRKEVDAMQDLLSTPEEEGLPGWMNIFIPISRSINYGVSVSLFDHPAEDRDDENRPWLRRPRDLVTLSVVHPSLTAQSIHERANVGRMYKSDGIKAIRSVMLNYMSENRDRSKFCKCNIPAHGAVEDRNLRTAFRRGSLEELIERYNIEMYKHCRSCNAKYMFGDVIPDESKTYYEDFQGVPGVTYKKGTHGKLIPLMTGVKKP